MVIYVLRRFVQMFLTVGVIVALIFTLIHLAPGDLASTLAGREAGPKYLEQVRVKYGLDKPVLVQFGTYLSKLIRGDLGYSYTKSQKVSILLMSRLPATILLMGTSLVIAVTIGVLGGTLAARFYGSALDSALSGLGVGAASIPVYWLGLVLMYVFSVQLGWLPTSGMRSIDGGGVLDILRHLVLPVTSLSFISAGRYLKITRASVAEKMGKDFITTYRAVGFDERTIFMKHALRNGLLPVVTMVGLRVGYLLAGAVLTETVFSWPGLGLLIYRAILSRDYPLILGGYLVMAIAVVVVVFIVDLTYVLLDPRVRVTAKGG